MVYSLLSYSRPKLSKLNLSLSLNLSLAVMFSRNQKLLLLYIMEPAMSPNADILSTFIFQ